MIGTAQRNALTRMLQDSNATGVLKRTSVPVELVAGTALSRGERWGVPAARCAVIGLLVASSF